MSTPPEQPGDESTPEQELSIEAQLDDLLSKIEDAEPGTLDPQVLPTPAQPTKPAIKAEQAATPAPSAELEIDALLNASPAEPPAESPTSEEIDELLNAPPAEAATVEPEQEQMLSALNTALKDLPEQPPADEPVETLSVEDQLQQEISALMSAEPAGSESHVPREASVTVIDEDDDDVLAGSFESPESLAAIEAAHAPTSSTEDQIAMEIEGLLATDQAPAATATAEPTNDVLEAIDELDQMLAQEIDADDELAGDFQSVEDLTAGIQVEEQLQAAEDDEHAATARDVAAELDSQPEDLPAPPSAETTEDPFKELDEAVDKAEPQRKAALQAADVKDWLTTAKDKLLVACFAINWPARRFLSVELRANLGYIALLNLFFGVGFWIVLILF
jgi:hypothetical protein